MNQRFQEYIKLSTREIVRVEDIDIFCNPYLDIIKDESGRILGHGHVSAYFDKDGNEYRPYYGEINIGESSSLNVDYNSKTSTNWGMSHTVLPIPTKD